MNADRFDALSRGVSISGSRRRILAITLSSALVLPLGLGQTEAHNPLKTCKKKSGKQKKTCLKKAKAHNAQHAAETASPPPPTSLPPTGCGTGQRSCPERGGCIPTAQCCTDADCAPVGTCDLATGTCNCNSDFLKTCPDAPGTCALCCVDSTGVDDCPGTTECREQACHCPAASGPCGCPEAVTNPPIACGTGFDCFCYYDMSDTTFPPSAQCGSFQGGQFCTSATHCDPGEFCGAQGFDPRQGGICTTTCSA
jgi:hypothetical protein